MGAPEHLMRALGLLGRPSATRAWATTRNTPRCLDWCSGAYPRIQKLTRAFKGRTCGGARCSRRSAAACLRPWPIEQSLVGRHRSLGKGPPTWVRAYSCPPAIECDGGQDPRLQVTGPEHGADDSALGSVGIWRRGELPCIDALPSS